MRIWQLRTAFSILAHASAAIALIVFGRGLDLVYLSSWNPTALMNELLLLFDAIKPLHKHCRHLRFYSHQTFRTFFLENSTLNSP